MENNTKPEAPSLYPLLNSLAPLFFMLGSMWEMWHDNNIDAMLFLVLCLSWVVFDLKKEIAHLHACLHGGVVVGVVAHNPTQEQSHD